MFSVLNVYLMGLFKQMILNQCFGKTEGFIIKDECIDCMDDCDCMHVWICVPFV